MNVLRKCHGTVVDFFAKDTQKDAKKTSLEYKVEVYHIQVGFDVYLFL